MANHCDADAQFSFPLASGLHFANPIPTEAAIPKAELDVFIDEAISMQTPPPAPLERTTRRLF